MKSTFLSKIKLPASFIVVMIGLAAFSFKSDGTENIESAKPDAIDKQVSEILASLTLEDKVGEMTQLTIDMLSIGETYNLKEPHQLDEEKIKKVLVELKVGSILNCGGHAYTREHWHEIIGRIQEVATKEKTNGIPVLYGIDAIHGTNYTTNATLFPQQIGLAATWNPSLAVEMGRITAYETRASGIPWNFSPVLDIGRDPRWPRLWETFGEDVFLAQEMGKAMVKGYQGDDVSDRHRVAACMKHFVGYSTPWSGKDRTPAYIPERQLREYYLPTFQAAVNAGAKTVMINSGEMNGIPVHTNPKILIDLLRNELGFTGLAVSDWEDIKYLYTRHKVAENYKDAIRISINAGVDMSMVPTDTDFPVLLAELVREGKVPMSRIDEAVSRILKLKIELGLFDAPGPDWGTYDAFASEAHSKAAYQAASESITLLKNEKSILPLNKESRILITGPTAHSLNCLNGGWTHTWQGDQPELNTKGKATLNEALVKKLGAAKVMYSEGCGVDEDINTAKTSELASKADVIVLCLGEEPYTEKPGDLKDLNLPAAQIELAKALAATGKPIVLVMIEGRPRIVREVEKLVDGVVMAYLPGNEGGRAIADVLLGEINPSGKLPYTYPRYANDLLTYDHKNFEKLAPDFSWGAFEPQWEFGDGLSYTSFEYSNLKLSTKQINEGGKLQVQVSVKNTGSRTGKETVQLFIRDDVATITPPAKRLRAFEKVELAAGESKVVKFEIKTRDLAFVGPENVWMLENGSFTVMVNKLTDKFDLKIESKP